MNSKKNIRKKFTRIVGEWTLLVLRYRIIVLALFLALTVAIAYYTVGHLGIITDTAGMLSPDLEYLKNYRAYKKAFPQSNDSIVVVIDGENPDIAVDARDRLAAALAYRARFKEVYAPGSEEFFRKNGLLYLSVPSLETLSDQLAEIQPLLGTLAREPDLRGLFSIMAEAESHGEAGRMERLYDEVERALDAIDRHRFYQVSWLNLMDAGSASLSRSNMRQFVIAYPVMDYTKILPGKAAMFDIRETAERLGLDKEHGVRIRLTGDIAMEYEELASVTRGAKLAGWLSLVMVTVVLFAGLRSWKLVAATLITLVTGLVWTAGFAAAAIGHLNMISVAFAVLFIGLGVDYSIHYCLRFHELAGRGSRADEALEATAKDTGSSLVLCAITTATGFFAFVPTDFSGVGELGLISGTGMFIGLFMNLTLLPALLSFMRLPPIGKGASKGRDGLQEGGRQSVWARIALFPVRHSRGVRTAAIVIALCSLVILPRITYDWNPLNLRDQTCESVSTFKELLADVNCSPWSLDVLEMPSEELEKRKQEMASLSVVDKVVDIADFIPSDQDEKLSIIEELDFTIGPVFMQGKAPPPTDAERITAIRGFIDAVKYGEAKGSERAAVIAGRLEVFLSQAEQDGQVSRALSVLEKSLVGTLPPRLRDLKLSLEAEPFGMKELPEEVTSRWVASDGRWRLEIFPAENLNSRERMIQFITEVRRYEPGATGYPVIIYEGGKVVSGAFKQAFSLSIAVITALLFFLMPTRKDALLVMVPLALSAMVTGALMELSGITLNFANIIALPLILGIGVDNGIHMVHRFRTMKRSAAQIFSTSTSRGIIFSTLTTICSFGNLAVSPHEGMASMGKLLALGVGITLVCTMVLLPALMAIEEEGAKNRSGI